MKRIVDLDQEEKQLFKEARNLLVKIRAAIIPNYARSLSIMT